MKCICTSTCLRFKHNVHLRSHATTYNPPKNSYRSRSTTAIRTIINLHCIVLNFSTTAYNCTHVYTQNSYTSYHAMVPTQMLPPQDAAIQDATTPGCHHLGCHPPRCHCPRCYRPVVSVGATVLFHVLHILPFEPISSYIDSK